MSKILFVCCALVLSLAFTGAAFAEAPQADVDAVLGLAQESCDAPAATVEPAVEVSLENELLVEANGGEPCNETTCGPQEFCCNFSCSICAPRGGVCTQQFCG
jgi:hypothetical protein